jgi:V8-like Glu-specific endopeptidase
MRRGLRPAWRPRRLPAWSAWALSVPAVGVLLLIPVLPSAERLAARLATAVTSLSRPARQVPRTGVNARPYGGSPAVGALFEVTNGKLGRHFCTAGVVDSPAGDLVITAAHCVSRIAPGRIAFVPGYHDGKEPYGAWTAARVIVDSQWRTSASPDHDVAFLVVHRPGAAGEIQQLTGGERLGAGWPPRIWVDVIGYPDGSGAAVACGGRIRPFGQHQLEFACGGFTGGTSGGPFVARVNASTGDGTVIGVIGGYQQGGDLASVSYSPRFGQAVRALYQTAIASG